MKKRRILPLFVVLSLLLCLFSCGKETETVSSETPTGMAAYHSENDYMVDIAIENYGTITLRLLPKVAPITVNNFVTLAQSGFYDGLTFHRIMENFMMQGGSPTGTSASSDTGNTITGEFAANGYNNPLSHKRGVLSMARAQEFNSGSCQFFIMHVDYPSLDGMYASFGYVTEGMDVVDAICSSARPIDGNGTIPAAEQPVMKTVTVRPVS